MVPEISSENNFRVEMGRWNCFFENHLKTQEISVLHFAEVAQADLRVKNICAPLAWSLNKGTSSGFVLNIKTG